MWEEIRITTFGGKSMKGKKYLEALNKVDRTKLYSKEEAVKLVKEDHILSIKTLGETQIFLLKLKKKIGWILM